MMKALSIDKEVRDEFLVKMSTIENLKEGNNFTMCHYFFNFDGLSPRYENTVRIYFIVDVYQLRIIDVQGGSYESIIL